jgi:hypothetical protein
VVIDAPPPEPTDSIFFLPKRSQLEDLAARFRRTGPPASTAWPLTNGRGWYAAKPRRDRQLESPSVSRATTDFPDSVDHYP